VKHKKHKRSSLRVVSRTSKKSSGTSSQPTAPSKAPVFQESERSDPSARQAVLESAASLSSDGPLSSRRPTADGRARAAAGRQIEINLGKACNNACRFCSNGAVPPEEQALVPIETISEEIRKAAWEGYDALGFLGGEPTIRKDLPTIIEMGRRAGFGRIALCTNGRRLRSPELLSNLIDAGLTRVTLSIHSHLPRIENWLCGRSSAYEQKMEAIDHLVAALARGRLPHGFALNTCIHGMNCEQLPDLAAFFRARGVGEIRFNLVRPEHLAVADPRLIPRLQRVTRAILRTIYWNEGRGFMRITFSDVPLCAYPSPLLASPELLLRYSGESWDLDTQVVVQRGEAGRDEFRWQDRRKERLKIHTDRCGSCAAVDRCEGPWIRSVELHGDGDLHPLRADPFLGKSTRGPR